MLLAPGNQRSPRRFRGVPRRSRPTQAVRIVISPSLVDIFEEDPVVKAAPLGTLAARFGRDVFPPHVMGRGEVRSASRTSASYDANGLGEPVRTY